jgi:hypothetical protein
LEFHEHFPQKGHFYEALEFCFLFYHEIDEEWMNPVSELVFKQRTPLICATFQSQFSLFDEIVVYCLLITPSQLEIIA